MNMRELIAEHEIPVVKTHGNFASAAALLAFTKPLVGVEGFVVSWPNGYRVKVKADHYVAIHRIKDDIRAERYIAKLILTETLDDKIPLMDQSDLSIVRTFEVRFDNAIENALERIEGLVMLARVLYGGVKKDVAINFIPSLLHKEDAPFIFSVLDGKELRPLVLRKVLAATSSGTSFDSAMKWMEA
jgi:hypothetical protein